LIVDTTLVAGSGILAGYFDAPDSIANVLKAAALATSAVHCQWVTNGRLHAKAIEYGSKNFIVVEAVN